MDNAKWGLFLELMGAALRTSKTGKDARKSLRDMCYGAGIHIEDIDSVFTQIVMVLPEVTERHSNDQTPHQ